MNKVKITNEIIHQHEPTKIPAFLLRLLHFCHFCFKSSYEASYMW